MIGRISGRIVERAATHILVDVHGVGYEIAIPLSTYARLANDDSVSLHTHLVVREDAHELYGFYTELERELFRALIKVNRVGPKLALAVLSGMEADVLADCIRSEDYKALAGIRGVGKKTAEQIVLDLRGSLPHLGVSGTGNVQPRGSNLADAESALIGLGFKPQQAAMALARAENPEADVETLIKEALKALG